MDWDLLAFVCVFDKAVLGEKKMTKKQRIIYLENRIDAMQGEIIALRERIAALEARPVTPYPWQPLPDPAYPHPGPYVSNTCGSNGK